MGHEEPFQNRLVLGALLIPRRYLLSVEEVRAVGTGRSRTATGRHLKVSSTASPPHANMLIFSC